MTNPTSAPAITVVIACFNVGSYLTATLQSVQAQSFQSFEVLMTNDGSTDDTLSIMECFAAGDHRFKVINLDRNHGVVAVRNAAMRQATGEYIAMLDGDDIWTREALAMRMELARSNPTVVVIATDFAWFTDKPAQEPVGRVGLGPRAQRAFAGCFAAGQSALLPDPFELVATTHFAWVGASLVRRDAMTAVGNFESTFEGPEDTLLWLRLANTGTFLFAPQITAFYRQRAGSLVTMYIGPKELHYLKVLNWISGRPEFSKRMDVVNRLAAECHHCCAQHYRRLGDKIAALSHGLAAVRCQPKELVYLRGLIAAAVDVIRRRPSGVPFQ